MKFLHSDLHTVTEQILYAQAFGVHWPDQGVILDPIISECKELRQEIEVGCNEKMQEEIGDWLHAAISLCVFSGFDVSETLGKTEAKFSKRMALLKTLTQEQGLESLHRQSIPFMMNLWKIGKIRANSDNALKWERYSTINDCCIH